MGAPALSVQVNGGPPVSGDNLNTYIQSCNTINDLRGFIGVTGQQVYMRGTSAVADGGQGEFYWNATGAAPDDGGVTTIVPSGSVAGSGEWTRIGSVNTSYTYNVPVTGFSITMANGVSSLLLKPAGNLSTGTIIMAPAPGDGQIFRVSCNHNITTLTISANTGQTILNAPTTLTAGTGYSFQYSVSQLTWFRLY